MNGHIFGQRIIAWHLLSSLQNMKDNIHMWVPDAQRPEVIEEAIRLCCENELSEGWGWEGWMA